MRDYVLVFVLVVAIGLGLTREGCGVHPLLVKNQVASSYEFPCGRVIHQPCGRVERVSHEHSLPCLVRKLLPRRYNDVHVRMTSEFSKIVEVREPPCDELHGDPLGSGGPVAVLDVDHRHDGMSPESVRELSNKRKGLGSICKCSSLSFNPAELPMRVCDCPLHCYCLYLADFGEVFA